MLLGIENVMLKIILNPNKSKPNTYFDEIDFRQNYIGYGKYWLNLNVDITVNDFKVVMSRNQGSKYLSWKFPRAVEYHENFLRV